nr:integrase, catalytic region, zinc finger, CCHC-type, peptidase aspartic, catalytic [Tanacetum cinerariifolium]
MSSNSDDIQAAGSDTRPLMLDRTDYDSWSQRIWLYCRGKENGIYILQSIDHGSFELGTTRDTLGTTLEGGVLLEPERPHTYDDLNDNEKKQFDADNNVKMLLVGSELTKEDKDSQLYDEFERFKMLQGENINEYYVRFHKLINDMRNIKMTMPNIQLNSKFVNNISPECDRFVTAVKLNKGPKETNHEQLYAYLKQYEKHVAQDRLIIERITPTTNDQLAFVSSVQPYTQSSQFNLINIHHHQHLFHHHMPNHFPGNGGAQIRAENVNAGQGKPIKCFNYNGLEHIARNCTQPKRQQIFGYFKDKMLLMQAQDNGAADECDAFDSDVDDEPTAQSIFMANLSSAGPTNQQAVPSNASILSEVHDLENAIDSCDDNQDEHEIHNEVNDVCVVPSCASFVSNDAYVLHDNDTYIPHDPLVTELNMYKEQVAIYEQRVRFELTLHEQKIDEQMSILIRDRNQKKENLKKELHSPKKLSDQDAEMAIEVKAMKIVFENLEAEVDQNAIDLKSGEIERKNLLITNENLIANCISLDVFYAATDSVLTVYRFSDMHEAFNATQKRIAELESENSNMQNKIQNDDHDAMVNHFSKLVVEHLNMQLKYQHLKESFENRKTVTSSDAPTFDSVFVIGKLKDQVQSRGNTICELREKISRLTTKHSEAVLIHDRTTLDSQTKELHAKINALHDLNEQTNNYVLTEVANLKAQLTEHHKSNCVTTPAVKSKVLAPGRYAIDIEPIPPRIRNNKEVHLDYLKHLKESVETLREIVEEAKVERPIDKSLASACLYTKHSQELLEYVIGTCPKDFNQQDKKHAATPVTRKKQVTFVDPCVTSTNNTLTHVKQQTMHQTNELAISSTGVNGATAASGSKPRSNTKKDITLPAKSDMQKVEVHPRNNKPICLLSKASKNKSWLWHRHLNHLNFGTINDLARKDLVRGLPRLKFDKDHMCSACQLGKGRKATHQPKTINTIMEVLDTLHMDLCGSLRVQSINGKKYILVIVDDYSRLTWVKFLRSKDETLEFVIKLLKKLQVGLNKTVSSGLVPNPAPAIAYVPPTKKELEILFQLMFDEYFEPSSVNQQVLPTPAVHIPVNPPCSSVSIFIDQDTPSQGHSPSSSDHQSSSVHHGVAADHSLEVNPFAPADNELFVNIFAPDPSSEVSSSGETLIAESNQSTQPHEHLRKWTDSHI